MTNLEAVLIDINKFINIDKDRKVYTGHFNTLTNELFGFLRQDGTFQYLFNGFQLGGSYGDKLKVKMPDEFDMVFHIKLPEISHAIVQKDPHLAGNVLIDLTAILEKIKTQKQHNKTYTILKEWTTPANYLSVNKMQSWIQGCFARALTRVKSQIIVNGETSKLQYKRMGPAHTIFVTGKYKYSVDFVPGILLNASQCVLPKDSHYKGNWEAIPKPIAQFKGDQISFRASYYLQEHNLIQNHKNLKNSLRMMKKFRDSKPNMNNLKSYYIKTLFLWKLRNDPNKAYWQNPLNIIVIDMFTELETRLFKEELPFFWNPHLNMLKDLTKQQKLEMLDCVRRAKGTLMTASKGLNPVLKYQTYSIFLNKAEMKTAGITNPNPSSNGNATPERASNCSIH